ncbi:MAG TPA: GxxExxY protein [Gemmatimonadaceae bacterium]|nr:GxxExxY protein [Gemmatimonadaceae bacterium]
MSPPDDPLTRKIIGICIEAHRILGPSVLESAYQKALTWDLRRGGIRFRQQVLTPALYHGLRIEPAYRVDLIVEEQVVVEIKAVDMLLPVHEAQVLTYMRLLEIPVGLLINFRVPVLKDGIRRLELRPRG